MSGKKHSSAPQNGHTLEINFRQIRAEQQPGCSGEHDVCPPPRSHKPVVFMHVEAHTSCLRGVSRVGIMGVKKKATILWCSSRPTSLLLMQTESSIAVASSRRRALQRLAVEGRIGLGHPAASSGKKIISLTSKSSKPKMSESAGRGKLIRYWAKCQF